MYINQEIALAFLLEAESEGYIVFHGAFVFLGVSCCRRINFYLKVWWFLLNVVFLQTRQINQMIDEKVDLLVIAPNQ